MKKIIKSSLVFIAFSLPLFVLLASEAFASDGSDGNDASDGQMIENNGSEVLKQELEYEPNSVLALNYHRVRDMTFIDNFLTMFSNSNELSHYSVETEEFDRQMRWLVENDAEFLNLSEVIKYYEQGEFPPRSVWINFDDMDQTIYDNAVPILEKYDIPATGFVITGHVGNEDFSNLELIDEESLKEMKESGLWEFGTHTHDMHYMNGDDESMVTESNPQAVYNDLNASDQYLQNNLNVEQTTIGYPFGQVTDETTNVLSELGVEYGFTLEEDIITPDSNQYYLPRILITEDSFTRLIESWEGFE